MVNKKGILIVDDNELDRSLLADILQEKYEVFTAENGREALTVLRANFKQVAVILLDLYMPVMNGYEFLSVQQADESIAEIPVIVITQQDNNDAEIEVLSYGASAYLTKPYVRELILQKIGDEIRKQEVDHLMKSIDVDTLTGCYNRDGFCKKAQILLREDEAAYDIVAFDIEQFRVVNDVYGIHEGDRLLQYLARIMTGFARERGGLCGRISGDCFVMLLTRKSGYEEEMVSYVDRAMERYPLQMKIVVRFGIYQIENRTIDVTVMYDRAVLAVKRIKGKYGELYAYFDDSMRDELLLEKEITNSMQQALADGEFLVYLQPKCNLKTEEYVGAEALIRWQNPERGLLPPGQFIPIFEKNGFITEVDLYVWEQVCQMLARWKKENRPLIPISVNVSRADLYHSDFLDRILELTDKYDIESSLLHMEITETVYTENQNQILDMVNQMGELGFKVEMDDFGSGYSSLNMLTEIPVDVLKLDMRFLEGYSAGKAKGNILEFSVGLAKSLGLESVAEGVETREMVDELRRLNCEMGQGYYFSRPIPIHEFEQKLDSNQKLDNSSQKLAVNA
ncbi:EAL domain-containing protein [Kineothrix sp. MSJ-39]|uniref:two-component system response regulator n=1 Tax=Kineothrix sp. MSJ-39 TaxID=2841533 RepID=UPI001C0FCFA9|nr:EAL domain-containing response regulator [Kineothrix sp. MSJ-39]MBU5430959.1 EAL domain-containing protein [Kineothrix sp. MSJ-39]